jgi:hypothetical protein
MSRADDGDLPTTAGPEAMGNSGIYIGGGTFTGAAFAAGAGAHAQQFSAGLDHAETLAQIDRLLQQLRDGASALAADEAEAVADDVERIGAEVHHRKPDQDSLSRLLGRITARLGPAVPLLTVVDQLKDLITTLLH